MAEIKRKPAEFLAPETFHTCMHAWTIAFELLDLVLSPAINDLARASATLEQLPPIATWSGVEDSRAVLEILSRAQAELATILAFRDDGTARPAEHDPRQTRLRES
jgi:hypothetical protein